jgi:hypothetical protein
VITKYLLPRYWRLRRAEKILAHAKAHLWHEHHEEFQSKANPDPGNEDAIQDLTEKLMQVIDEEESL